MSDLTMKTLVRDERGATAIEYALIAGMIALAIVAIVVLVGTNLTARFQSVLDAFS